MEAGMMKNTDNNTWILIITILIFVVGAVLMGVSGEPLSSISHCCFKSSLAREYMWQM
jgi:hypothetical protein